MPTYEYRCSRGHEFELFQRMSDEPRADCPTCGDSAQRLLSAGAGFLFRGEGFYITDYRSDAYRSAAKKEEGGGSAGKGSSSGDVSGSKGGSGSAGTTGSNSTGTGSGGSSGASSAGTGSSGGSTASSSD